MIRQRKGEEEEEGKRRRRRRRQPPQQSRLCFPVSGGEGECSGALEAGKQGAAAASPLQFKLSRRGSRGQMSSR